MKSDIWNNFLFFLHSRSWLEQSLLTRQILKKIVSIWCLSTFGMQANPLLLKQTKKITIVMDFFPNMYKPPRIITGILLKYFSKNSIVDKLASVSTILDFSSRSETNFLYLKIHISTLSRAQSCEKFLSSKTLAHQVLSLIIVWLNLSIFDKIR